MYQKSTAGSERNAIKQTMNRVELTYRSNLILQPSRAKKKKAASLFEQHQIVSPSGRVRSLEYVVPKSFSNGQHEFTLVIFTMGIIFLIMRSGRKSRITDVL